MSTAPATVQQKALRINLDPARYGTFAEIGAGQEVARSFFRVGGASGTVAKTSSAYDMAVSDAIYADRPGKCWRCATRSATRSSRRTRNSFAMRWISPSSAIEMLSSVADTANRHRISVSFCS